MNNEMQQDWEMAAGHLPLIAAVLEERGFKVGDVESDTTDDLTVNTDQGLVLVRMRRPEYMKYADVTIRAYRIGRGETERDRIRGGYGRWYLFAWAYDRGSFANWILVDLDRFRSSALMEIQRIIYNPDKETGFIAVKIADLMANECIIDQRKGWFSSSNWAFDL